MNNKRNSCEITSEENESKKQKNENERISSTFQHANETDHNYWFPLSIWMEIFQFIEAKYYPNIALVCKIWKCALWSSLNQIYLKNFKLDSKGLEFLSSNCLNLQKLHVQSCNFLSDFAIHNSLHKFSKLQSLNLSWCQRITWASIEFILKELPGLQSLNLMYCRSINDENSFFRHTNLIAESSNLNPKLKSLDLSWTPIKGDKFIYLCNYCQKSNLQYLNLCGCEEIEEYAFFCLLKFTSLTYLNLKHTKLSANFEQIIVKHLSHLTKVEFLNYSPQMDFNSSNLDKLASDLSSGSKNLQLDALTIIRKKMASEKTKPINEIIQAGMIPLIVPFVSLEKDELMQLEATWILTNVASGSSTQTFFILDCTPNLVNLLRSLNQEIVLQAIWALGNISGDGPLNRNKVLESGGLEGILRVLNTELRINEPEQNVSIIKYGTWVLANLCHGTPKPPLEIMSPAIDTLSKLIYSRNEEIVFEACWALSHFSDGDNEWIQKVIDSGICPRLIELTKSPSVCIAALSTLGNIATGDNSQAQLIIEYGLLLVMPTLLFHFKRTMRIEACWTLSNICAGTSDMIQAVIDASLFPLILNILNSHQFDILKEAFWCIANAFSEGNEAQIRYLLNIGTIPLLLGLTNFNEHGTISLALQTLQTLIPFKHILKEQGLYDLIISWLKERNSSDALEMLSKFLN